MNLYNTSFRKATARAEYARGFALDAHPKSRWIFQDPGFRDHAPDRPPERLDHIVAEVVGNAGQAALDHWLREAARTTGPEHDEAVRIGCKIAEMIGVSWSDVFSGEAA
jgi:hypothetical protein